MAAKEFTVKHGIRTPNVKLLGATSGTIILQPPASAGNITIDVPATSGRMVTTGDTETVTNTMLAGSIANNKLVYSSLTIGATTISLGTTTSALAGIDSITANNFYGAINKNVPAGSEGDVVYSTMAANDFFRIRTGGASNAGWVEIATADDGTEPIYVRQYTGVFTTLARTATLLDGDGNTSFPRTVYAPTFSGALSGNASTATKLSNSQSDWSASGAIASVVGLLAWKNYGSGHVIFDASQGISPSGGAINNTDASIAWSASFPTLMGWNGAYTYGVRVDNARISDSSQYLRNNADAAGGLIKFHWNDPGNSPSYLWGGSDGTNMYVYPPSRLSVNYAASAGNADTTDGLHVHGGVNNEANKIVRTDGNGYIMAGYINSENGNENIDSSPPRVWGTNGSDSYLRTYRTSALSVGTAAVANSLAADALVTNPKIRPTVSFIAGDRTLQPTDEGKVFCSANASGTMYVRIPNNASFGFGSQITVVRYAAGDVRLEAIAPAILNGGTGLKLRDRYSAVTLIKVATYDWIAIGDLAA